LHTLVDEENDGHEEEACKYLQSIHHDEMHSSHPFDEWTNP